MSEIKKVDESAKVDEFGQPNKKWTWILLGSWIAYLLLGFILCPFIVRFGKEPQTVAMWPWFLVWVTILQAAYAIPLFWWVVKRGRGPD